MSASSSACAYSSPDGFSSHRRPMPCSRCASLSSLASPCVSCKGEKLVTCFDNVIRPIRPKWSHGDVGRQLVSGKVCLTPHWSGNKRERGVSGWAQGALLSSSTRARIASTTEVAAFALAVCAGSSRSTVSIPDSEHLGQATRN